MRKALGDIAVSGLPSELRRLWYTRHDEPEQEEFISLPDWMPPRSSEPPQSRDLEVVVAYLLTTVTEREAFVIVRRFWFDDTLDEVGHLMQITRERVRQIEMKALRKLRHPSRATLLALATDLPKAYTEAREWWWKQWGNKVPDEFVEWVRESTYKKVGIGVAVV